MSQESLKHGQPHERHEGGLDRTERNPFAASGPIWAHMDQPVSKEPGRKAGAGFAHTLVVLGILGLCAGLALPWAAPARYGTPVDLVRQGLLFDFLRDGLYIFHVVYLNVAALSLAGGLLLFCILLMALNRAMNIPVLTGCAGLLLALIMLSVALGLVFLFVRQHLLAASLGSEPVAPGLYVWFGGLGLLILGLAAEYVAHLRRAGPNGPSGLGRVL
jgi:hypothetical protein